MGLVDGIVFLLLDKLFPGEPANGFQQGEAGLSFPCRLLHKAAVEERREAIQGIWTVGTGWEARTVRRVHLGCIRRIRPDWRVTNRICGGEPKAAHEDTGTPEEPLFLNGE